MMMRLSGLALAGFLVIINSGIAAGTTKVLNGQAYEQVNGDWFLVESNGDSWEIAPNRIEIRFVPGTSVADRNLLASTLELQLSRTLSLNDYRFMYDSQADPTDVLESVLEASIVEDAILDTYVKPAGDQYYENQWNLFKVDVPRAWTVTTGSSPVVIGIIDFGIDRFHEDLEATRWTNPHDPPNGINEDAAADLACLQRELLDDWWGWDFVEEDNEPFPGSIDPKHGTSVAGMALAVSDNTIGLASIAGGSATQRPIKWASFEVATTMMLRDAVDYCRCKGIKILNISLDAQGQSGANTALRDFWTSGGLVFAASGNGFAHELSWPAKFDSVMAVGATDPDDIRWAYSNRGPGLDLVAPSGFPDSLIGVWSTDNWAEQWPFGWGYNPEICACPPENDRYFSLVAGTSAAAPQAAAVAALVWSHNPTLSNQAVEQILRRSARDLGSPGWDREYGYGRVDSYRALTQWGTITSNTTWGAPGPNVIHVSGDLTVAPGVTLTILPGTIVRIATDDNEHTGVDQAKIEFNVQGTLAADGTGANPIVFESWTPATPADWIGIRFETASKGVLSNVAINNGETDVAVDEFVVSVADWAQTKTMYLNTDYPNVTADLTIPQGNSLYLLGASLAKVAAGSGVDITVNGSLIMKGSATKKPELRSTTEVDRSWGVLTLSSTSQNNVFHYAIIRDALVSIRSYVPLTVNESLIEDGTDGIQAYNNLLIRNTTIRDLTGSGVVWLAGNLELRKAEIHNADYGVRQSTATSTGTFLCRNSKFHDIAMRGIDCNWPTAGMTIGSTTVEDANDGMYLISQTSVAIDSCKVRDNDIGISLLVGSGARIRRCAIDNNTTTGVYLVQYTDYSNTVMELDTVTYSPVGVHFYYGSGGWVKDSRILNNSLGVKCQLNSIPVVRTTRIAYGGTGVFAGEASNPDLGHATGGTCGAGAQEGKNSIHNQTTHYVANFDPAVTVYAECNYWGSGGAPPANKFYGNVDRTPYRTSDPNPVPPIEPPPGPGDGPPDIPKTYALHANHPNPFNPVTTIGYDVPAPGGRVEIAIYDVNGRHIRTLVENQRPAGSHSAMWQSQDERGEPVASGVYFVRMTAGAFTQTRKVVLLK